MLDPVAAVFVVLDGGINVLPVPDTTVLIGLDTNDVLSGEEASLQSSQV